MHLPRWSSFKPSSTKSAGRLVGEMQNMVAHANDLIASSEVKRSLQKLDRTLDNIERLARPAQVQIGPLFVSVRSPPISSRRRLPSWGMIPDRATILGRIFG
jgi:hypothetical protein